MFLTPQDVELFFKLHRALMFFVNQRLRVISDEIASPEQFSSLPPEVRLGVRDALLSHTDLLQSFVDENPHHFSADELDVVRSWQHLVHGKFYVFRQLKKYMVFLAADKQPVAYGVLALSQPFEELIGPYLPILTDTVLLPFRDKIVYDGLMSSYRISFGSGIRRSLNESFKQAKTRHGIVTSLPMSEEPLPPKAPKARPAPKLPSKTETARVLRVTVELVERFCREHLTDEYADLCRKLAEKLARKRPSPLLSGNPSTWACGIVRTIGWVNFLHDKSQTPHMRLSDIDASFGISESSGAAKLGAIRKLLRIHQLDPEWTLPSGMDDNPRVWILEVDGFMVDVRDEPREVQEIAYTKGLIPFIPADRQQRE
jgi:hypothetical protein